MGLEPTTFCLGSIRALALWHHSEKPRIHAVFFSSRSDRLHASYRVHEHLITGDRWHYSSLRCLSNLLSKTTFPSPSRTALRSWQSLAPLTCTDKGWWATQSVATRWCTGGEAVVRQKLLRTQAGMARIHQMVWTSTRPL